MILPENIQTKQTLTPPEEVTVVASHLVNTTIRPVEDGARAVQNLILKAPRQPGLKDAPIEAISLMENTQTIAKNLLKLLVQVDHEILMDINLILAMVVNLEAFAEVYAEQLTQLESRVQPALEVIKQEEEKQHIKGLVTRLDTTFLASMVITHLRKLLDESAKNQKVYQYEL